MYDVLDKVCLLVTAAFALTFVPGVRRRRGYSLLSVRDQGTALIVFLVLGLVEEAAAAHVGWFNERVVAACTSGLVAGPWVGLAVGVFTTGLAVMRDGLPMWTIGVAMVCGGVIGGWLHRHRPGLAGRLPVGFCLTVAMSWLRSGLTYWDSPQDWATLRTFSQLGVATVVEGLGTALILEIVALARERDERTQAAAQAEVRALQARMNPHFLFNALNTLAALSMVAPREIPRAAGRLRHFLRASFDQPERLLVPLCEEIEVVRAYLDIERLRFGDRLHVEESIPEELAQALIPPFSLQPVVENAVQHGLQSSTTAGRLSLFVRQHGTFLALSVHDNGCGVVLKDVESAFFGDGERTHALALLRRRLRGLFGRTFQMEVRSSPAGGTTVTLRLPLRMQERAHLDEALEPATLNPDAPVLR